MKNYFKIMQVFSLIFMVACTLIFGPLLADKKSFSINYFGALILFVGPLHAILVLVPSIVFALKDFREVKNECLGIWLSSLVVFVEWFILCFFWKRIQ